MLWTTTTRFRTICRIVLCLFVFQSLHPATWRVPWKLDISFDTWPLNFGPTLAYGQSSDPNLAATPDANKDDPFIIQKAQELGNNPVSIFNFVRDEIGYGWPQRLPARGTRHAVEQSGQCARPGQLADCLIARFQYPGSLCTGNTLECLSPATDPFDVSCAAADHGLCT